MIDEILAGAPAGVVYLVVGLLVGVESVGVPLPGETALIAAALISTHPHSHVSPVLVAGCACIGAILGDSTGYAVGRRFGPRLFAWLGRRFPRHWSADQRRYAQHLFRDYGMPTVFFARFVALLRMAGGPMAGSLTMPYGRFLVANAAGAVAWTGGITLLVHTLGHAAHHWVARSTWVLFVVAVLVSLAVGRFATRRFRQGMERYLASEQD